jgi:predicted porin
VYAQNATVQVYGRATVEYGYADQGAGRPNTDIFQTPGGSSVGFKGQEQLGGGLSAWFQCESSADVRGLNQDGFCGRNSAIGLRSSWGNLFFGRWDTPFKRATLGMVGAGDTGLLGAAFTFVGNSTGTGAMGGQTPQSLARNVWKRRESSTINYETPDFSGFKVAGAFSAANATNSLDASTAQKPRIGSIAGFYSNGPLNIAAGYEKHWDFGAIGGPNDDRGWTIGASYNFMGNLLVGIQYVEMKYETTTTTEAKKKNWFIGADWNFAGPHHVLGAYVKAGDTKGNSSLAQLTAAGLNTGNGPLTAGDSGADFWEIMYGYDFSKRTSVKFGYVRLSNDSDAFYSLGGLARPTIGGENQSAWVMYGQHSW